MPSIEDYFIINEISHVRAGKEKCVKSQNYILPLFSLLYVMASYSLFLPFSLFQNSAGFDTCRFKLVCAKKKRTCYAKQAKRMTPMRWRRSFPTLRNNKLLKSVRSLNVTCVRRARQTSREYHGFHEHTTKHRNRRLRKSLSGGRAATD